MPQAAKLAPKRNRAGTAHTWAMLTHGTMHIRLRYIVTVMHRLEIIFIPHAG